jgi:DNA-binding response OmpR family regulator
MDQPMVWVISPDPDACHLIGLNLSKRGMQVVEIWMRDLPASSWAKPDLIVVDADAPDEIAWQTIRAVRASAWAIHVPLILLLPVEPSASQLASAQPARWLAKPLDVDQLLTMVREYAGQIFNLPHSKEVSANVGSSNAN